MTYLILGYCRFKIVAGLTLIALFLGASAARAAALQAVAPDVYVFPGADGDANAGVVVGDQGVVVIDSSPTPETARALKAEIKRLTPKPILYVVLTHFHGDHTFSVHELAPTRGIISHVYTKDYLAEHGADHLKQYRAMLGEAKTQGAKVTLPTITFPDMYSIPMGKQHILLFYQGRGHTRGDIVAYLPTAHVLFTGDLAYAGRVPWMGDAYVKEWQQTLDRLAVLDVTAIVPGHGKWGGMPVLTTFREYLTDLYSAVFVSWMIKRPIEAAKKEVQLPKYESWLKYKEWLPANVEKVYQELVAESEGAPSFETMPPAQ
ncbi:MAG TPA: MBL fold metallo-hydrolase [Nitrospiria bacterium]|nr:MBL fold metallo-hydrolase [Nitrospiria bacterium]